MLRLYFYDRFTVKMIVILVTLVCFATANFHEDTLLTEPMNAAAEAPTIQQGIVDPAQFQRMAGESIHEIYHLCASLPGCSPEMLDQSHHHRNSEAIADRPYPLPMPSYV